MSQQEPFNETEHRVRTPLPPVSALQAFAEHTRKEGALSEYWFIHNSTPGKHRKPVYGWAGGKSALDKKMPDGLGPYVSWESVVSATWEQLTGAEAVSKSMDKDVSAYVKGFLAYVNMINPDQAVEDKPSKGPTSTSIPIRRTG